MDFFRSGIYSGNLQTSADDVRCPSVPYYQVFLFKVGWRRGCFWDFRLVIFLI